ncbi:hypothetical protein [Kitasatospora sp. LaBMicrA B282]|uniref:hypothetical protein n=1 Tax=Kitasatospora sp. LaBMicrA B282 TaxID=3420949 RepID=UPI003D0DB471
MPAVGAGRAVPGHGRAVLASRRVRRVGWPAAVLVAVVGGGRGAQGLAWCLAALDGRWLLVALVGLGLLGLVLVLVAIGLGCPTERLLVGPVD